MTATQEQCVNNTGLPANLYGNPGLDSPADQYNFLQGGNTDLAPEESDTISFGGIWSPAFIDGLTISIDYFNIEIEGRAALNQSTGTSGIMRSAFGL